MFDVSDGGATLIVYLNRPTNHEVSEFKKGKLKMGYYLYKNVIMLLVKVGDMPWMDAPYSVHLSKHITNLNDVGESQGLATTIMLVDAQNGEIKTIRVVGMNHRLTKGLFEAIRRQESISFENYDENIRYLYRTYSTKELLKRASMVENLAIKK